MIELVHGDLTEVRADAIVNAANAALRGGGGVDGAIHRAAGPELLAACRAFGGCATGNAVVTPAFALEARGVRHIIHAVGPVWRGGTEGEALLLRGAYGVSMQLADSLGCRSVAFPSISTGAYGFPLEEAASIAVDTARRFLARPPVTLREVRFVLFDERSFAAFETASS